MAELLTNPAIWASLFAITLIQVALGADNLIVITIIAILAAMLLPVLGRAKKAARDVLCINHLHELAIRSAARRGGKEGSCG